MILQFISYIPAILGIVSIGLFVLLNARNLQNKVFALLNLFIAAWLTCLFIASITSEPLIALWFLRSGLFFAAIGFLLFFYFALLFPYRTVISRRRVIFYSLPLYAVALLSFTPLIVSGVQIDSYGVQPLNAGFLYTFADVISILYLIAGIGLILSKFNKADSQQKKTNRICTARVNHSSRC